MSQLIENPDLKNERVEMRSKLIKDVELLTHEEIADLLLKWPDRVRSLQAALVEIVKVTKSEAHLAAPKNALNIINRVAGSALLELQSSRKQ